MARNKIVVSGEISPATMAKFFFLRFRKLINLKQSKNGNWTIPIETYSAENEIRISERDLAKLLADFANDITKANNENP